MFDVIRELFTTSETERQDLLDQFRKFDWSHAVYLPGLSIDPNGVWSLRQAAAVLRVIGPEAEAMGLEFRQVDITNHSMPSRRVLLRAYCKRHKQPVALNYACEECLREWPK